MKITDRQRIHLQERDLRERLREMGETDPSTEPNGTHAALWRRAHHLGLATEEQVAAAAKALDWQWSYTGD